MASWYVYSGAAGAGTGADWANAFTTLAAALSAGAAGDTYYTAQDHAETQASALTLTFKGTAAAWDKILCVNRAGSVPPVSADLRYTATITTTGGNSLILGGGSQYYYISGVSFSAGSGAVSNLVNVAGLLAYLYRCGLIKAGTTGSSQGVTMSAGTAVLDNTTIQFGSATDAIRTSGSNLVWKNTASAIGGATLPTNLLNTSAAGNVTFDGLDLSSLGSGKTLISAPASQLRVQLINCKLGASVTIAATPTVPRSTIDLLISNSTTGNSRMERYAYEGTLTTETTIVLTTGAATDGTTPISWKLASTANTQWINPFEAFTYAEWVETLAATTRTFEMVNDGTTLTNADLWCEVEYLGSALTPVSSLVSTGTADILASGVNLTTSTAVWTTTGIASPVLQKIAVTFTPAMKGFYRLVFRQAKASKTVYVNPRPNEV